MKGVPWTNPGRKKDIKKETKCEKGGCQYPQNRGWWCKECWELHEDMKTERKDKITLEGSNKTPKEISPPTNHQVKAERSETHNEKQKRKQSKNKNVLRTSTGAVGSMGEESAPTTKTEHENIRTDNAQMNESTEQEAEFLGTRIEISGAQNLLEEHEMYKRKKRKVDQEDEMQPKKKQKQTHSLIETPQSKRKDIESENEFMGTKATNRTYKTLKEASKDLQTHIYSKTKEYTPRNDKGTKRRRLNKDEKTGYEETQNSIMIDGHTDAPLYQTKKKSVNKDRNKVDWAKLDKKNGYHQMGRIEIKRERKPPEESKPAPHKTKENKYEKRPRGQPERIETTNLGKTQNQFPLSGAHIDKKVTGASITTPVGREINKSGLADPVIHPATVRGVRKGERTQNDGWTVPYGTP
jgi:hypothetical protein